MKAANCDDCEHGSSPDAERQTFLCAKGHKPRFYMPILHEDYYVSNWGWKRRCGDFAIRARSVADHATVDPDCSVCPRCLGPADNGHDREYPPNPYLCSKCAQEGARAE